MNIEKTEKLINECIQLQTEIFTLQTHIMNEYIALMQSKYYSKDISQEIKHNLLDIEHELKISASLR